MLWVHNNYTHWTAENGGYSVCVCSLGVTGQLYQLPLWLQKRTKTFWNINLIAFVTCLIQLIVRNTNWNDVQRIQLGGLLKIFIGNCNIIKKLHWYCQINKRKKIISFTPAFIAMCVGNIFQPSFDMLCNLAYVIKYIEHNRLLYHWTWLLVMKDGFIWHQTKARSIRKSLCES